MKTANADGKLINPQTALAALDKHLQHRMQWMSKAATLMQMVNAAGVDHGKLREVCEEDIQAMPEF